MFVRQAWSTVEPSTPFVSGWHLDAIADHLEAVSNGQIQNLLINMPPRHMKSLAVSVFWPTWEWASHPERRWLFSSYAASLSIRDSLKCRRLIESPWYQHHWGHVFTLTSDQNAKTRYDNDKTGYRIATSVGGAATGEGGDRIVVDDPHNVQDAISEAIRVSTLTWWAEVMSTRLNDPKTGAKVIVMQRCHERDLSGFVIEQGSYEHLCLPAEYDGRKTVTSIGWSDPRAQHGDLLWPERFGAPELAALKASMGSYAASGQLQQRPAPAGGGMFKREWFPIVDAAPAALEWCRFWDCAGTEAGGVAADPDWTVGTKVGRDKVNGIFYVAHVVRDRKTPGVIDQLIAHTASMDGSSVRIREEQEPGSSGKNVIAAHTRLLAGFDYRGIPATGEKTTRWRPFAVQAEAGNVRVVRGEWNQAWLDEMVMAPMGSHDDQVDSVCGAFNELALRHTQAVAAVTVDTSWQQRRW